MEWLSITSDLQHRNFQLKDNQEKLLKLSYDPKSGAVRITADEEKRVFFIAKEGFLRNHTVLRNEYGVRIGQLTHDGGHIIHGNIEIAEEQFNYSLQGERPVKTAIYNDGELIAVCDLPAGLKGSRATDHDVLVMILCWRLAVGIERQEEVYA